MMALQNALEGKGSAGRAGLNPAFENLPEKQKRTRLNALLVSPCCRARATPLVRWALLFLASLFASTPYLAPGYGLCEASPAALPFVPSGRVRREYTTMA